MTYQNPTTPTGHVFSIAGLQIEQVTSEPCYRADALAKGEKPSCSCTGCRQRAADLALIYRHTHRDFKGKLADGARSMLVNRGATCLVPLEHLTAEEIAQRLPSAKRKEAERLQKKAGKE